MKNYTEMPTVGYWSDMGGVELKELEYGIVDYAKVVAGTMSSAPTSHRVKIYTTDSDIYINLHGRRLKFSDCMFVFQKVYYK